MSTAVEVMGFLIAIIGASAMDSASIVIPVIITGIGALVMFVGLSLERKGF